MPRVFSDYFTTWHENMAMSRTAMAAVRAGYGVVPVRPGGKVPLCTLTAHQRSKDKGHPCGNAHVITDATVAKRVFDRLAVELGMEVNIGIVAGPSRLVVVDADTPEAVASFRGQWAQAVEDSRYLVHSPTVSTPGSLVDGVWRHKDGGHWYFDVPEGITLPEYPTQLRGADGYEVRWGNQMTVAPPSRRPEGPYIVNGDALEIPAWLLTVIQDTGARRMEHVLNLADRYVNDGIVAWAVQQDWLTWLLEDHWTDTSKLDTCGCPIVEKPGGGTSSSKSATAHNAHCSAPIYPNVEGHGALHLWTDDPPEPLASWMTRTGKRTITLFQYVVLTRYDDDELAAKIGLGITPDLDAWDPRIPESQPPSTANPGIRSDQDFRGAESQPREPIWDSSRELTIEELEGAPGSPLIGLPDEIRKAVKLSARQQRIPRLGAQWNEFVDSAGAVRVTSLRASEIKREVMETTVCARADGVFTLYPRRVSSIFGPSDSGKSWFGLYSVVDTATRGRPCAYVDLEDDEHGFAHRLDLLHIPIEVQDRILYRRLWYPPTDLELHTLTRELGPTALIVIDSIDALLTMMGIDTNANGAVRGAGNLLKRLGRGGAAILIVDHSTEKNRPGERSETPIGSSAKKAFVDGVMLRADRMSLWVPGQVCETMIMLGKDRHTEARINTVHDGSGSLFGRFAKLRLEPALVGSTEAADQVPRLTLEAPPSYTADPGDTTFSADELGAHEDAFIKLLGDHDWHTRTELLAAAGDKNGRGGLGKVLDKYVTDFAAVLDVDVTEGVGRRPTQRYRLPPDDPPTPEEGP